MSKHIFHPHHPFAARVIFFIILLCVPLGFFIARDVVETINYSALIKNKKEELNAYELVAKELRNREKISQNNREKSSAAKRDLRVFEYIERVWDERVGIGFLEVNNDEKKARIDVSASHLNDVLDFTTRLQVYFHNSEITNHKTDDSAGQQWQVSAVINLEYEF